MVGIAYFIYRRSIMIFISNAHPTIRLLKKAIFLTKRYGIDQDYGGLVGIYHFIDRRSIMILISNAHSTFLWIGGHCLFHLSPFNHDIYQQWPPYILVDWWAFPI